MVLVLATAGVAGLGLTLPVTAAITVLPLVLVLSYRQLIAAFPTAVGLHGGAPLRRAPDRAVRTRSAIVVARKDLRSMVPQP